MTRRRWRFLPHIFGLALCVGLGLFAGIGGYTFYYAEGVTYLSDEPRACVNCHVMRDAGAHGLNQGSPGEEDNGQGAGRRSALAPSGTVAARLRDGRELDRLSRSARGSATAGRGDRFRA